MSAYRLTPGVPVVAEVRRVATEQVAHAVDDLDRDDRHEAAHEVRKRCKKLRALIRLVRGSAPEVHATENALLRDTARRLSGDRDHAAAVEAFEAMVAELGDRIERRAFDAIRDGLLRRRDRDTGPWDDQRAAVRADLEALQDRIGGWPLNGEGFDALHGGFRRTYRAARRRMADAYTDGGSAAFHEWRKQVKYHWHHLQLVRDAWPEVLRAQAAQAHALSELLGHEHDLGLLLPRLREDPDAHGGMQVVGPFQALVERRRGHLLAEARTLGGRCFAERPKALAARVEGYWAAASDAEAVPGSSAGAT